MRHRGEVTPLKSVDDYDLGVGPVTLAIQKAYLERCLGGDAGRSARPHGRAHTRRLTQATTRIRSRARTWASGRRSSCSRCSPAGSLGPMIERFEELIAERTGAPHAVAPRAAPRDYTSSRGPRARARAGDHLPVLVRGVGELHRGRGATPVFADVDPRTLNLDPAAVEAAITDRTKAIVAVDIFGYPCELDELRALADHHGLALIDDACGRSAPTTRRPLGSHGTSAVFAFCEQAGRDGRRRGGDHALGGRVAAAAEACATRALVGRRWFHHPHLGLNYRWTDLQAAVGIAQLEKLDEILASQRGGRALRRPAVRRRGRRTPLPDDAEHSLVVRLRRRADEGIDRTRVAAELSDQGIECGEYLPCILQPYMREAYGFAEGLCPVAEDASRRTLALPFFPHLEPDDQERVASALSGVLAGQ